MCNLILMIRNLNRPLWQRASILGGSAALEHCSQVPGQHRLPSHGSATPVRVGHPEDATLEASPEFHRCGEYLHRLIAWKFYLQALSNWSYPSCDAARCGQFRSPRLRKTPHRATRWARVLGERQDKSY